MGTQPRMEQPVEFDFAEKKSKLLEKQRQHDINEEIEEHVQKYMTIPLNEFWETFSAEIESAKSKQGVSVAAIAKACKVDKNLVSLFRKGPMDVIVEDEDIED